MLSIFFIFFSLFFTSIFLLSNSLKILMFADGVARSHALLDYRLAGTLSKKGHQVTVLFTAAITDPTIINLIPPAGVKVIHHISMESNSNDALPHLMDQAFQNRLFSYESMFDKLAFMMGNMVSISQKLADACEKAISNLTLLNELKEENFDIVFGHSFGWCPLAIGSLIGQDKFIVPSSNTSIFDNLASYLRIPTLPAYIPNIFSHFMDRMTFWDRIQNTLAHFTFRTFLPFLSGQDAKEGELFRAASANLSRNASNGKSLGEIVREKALGMLLNGEEMLNFPRPVWPGTLYLGQMETHTKVKTLSREWLGEGTEGVILFSLGTVSNTSMMPMKIKRAFLDAFKQFSRYSIIWRVEGELPEGIDEQKHIKIVKWLPQRDLLYSGRVRLFITHGGYNSLVETAQAGVPMILLPLFADQYGNAKRAVRHQIGIELGKDEIEAQIITRKMKAILYDTKPHSPALRA